MASTVLCFLSDNTFLRGNRAMIRVDQPYTCAKPKDSSSLASFFIWAVIWIAVLLAVLPR